VRGFEPQFEKTCEAMQKNVKSHVFFGFSKKRKKTCLDVYRPNTGKSSEKDGKKTATDMSHAHYT